MADDIRLARLTDKDDILAEIVELACLPVLRHTLVGVGVDDGALLFMIRGEHALPPFHVRTVCDIQFMVLVAVPLSYGLHLAEEVVCHGLLAWTVFTARDIYTCHGVSLGRIIVVSADIGLGQDIAVHVIRHRLVDTVIPVYLYQSVGAVVGIRLCPTESTVA